MKMKFKENIVWGVVLIFLVTACSKEDTPANLPTGETIITAHIDEELWEALEYESALSVVTGKGQFFELSGSGNNYKLNLSVLEFDKSTGTISEGTYDDTENFFLSLYIADEEGDYLMEYQPILADEDEELTVRIVITASSNSRISGTFSGIVHKVSQEEEDDYPEFLIISNGVFNNLPFETHTINIQ